MADKAIIVSGGAELEQRLAKLRTSSPGFEKRLREAIRKVLLAARRALSQSAKSGLEMQEDPRQAYKAVRAAVYRRIFGGQVNILQSRRAGAMRYYEPPRHPAPRGGNRASQSRRTRDIMSYTGKDRGFILRFQNQGTAVRAIHSMGGESLRTGGVRNVRLRSIGGNRGMICARNWFDAASQSQMEKASADMQALIDKIINEEFV